MATRISPTFVNVYITIIIRIRNKWVRRWCAIAHLKGHLYHLPGGPNGRRHVDQLSVEMSHLAAGIMVFLAVILQHHRMVRKGADIRRVINDRLSKWSNEFDMLVEEAVWCDSTLKTFCSKTLFRFRRS